MTGRHGRAAARHYTPIHRRAARAALLCWLATATGPGVAAPVLASDTDTATAGFYRLTWETDARRVELQEAATPDFRAPRVFYEGADRATVISGKPDGTWYYRVRALDGTDSGAWSPVLAVRVEHHDLSRALTFFAIGFTLFVATAATVMRGARGGRS